MGTRSASTNEQNEPRSYFDECREMTIMKNLSYFAYAKYVFHVSVVYLKLKRLRQP